MEDIKTGLSNYYGEVEFYKDVDTGQCRMGLDNYYWIEISEEFYNAAIKEFKGE